MSQTAIFASYDQNLANRKGQLGTDHVEAALLSLSDNVKMPRISPERRRLSTRTNDRLRLMIYGRVIIALPGGGDGQLI